MKMCAASVTRAYPKVAWACWRTVGLHAYRTQLAKVNASARVRVGVGVLVLCAVRLRL